tara:strand:+ start:172 stop:1173 length:1002 start_codon:yes stop_codon:yes gene_type:complete
LRNIKVGIIGLGVGEQHLKMYQEIDECEVIAVCDVDISKANNISTKYQISETYSDWKKITEHPNIDAISICSFDNYHAEQAISAFQSDKHVFIEKPIVLDRYELELLFQAYNSSKKLISSNLILRTEPRFKALKKMINKGQFGKIFYMEGDYLHDILWKLTNGWRGKMNFYSVIYGGGIHLIDLMRWLHGKEVIEACGMSNKILTEHSKYKYPDLTCNILKFEDEVIAKTTTTFGPRRPKFHALNIYGSKRTFINDRPHGKIYENDKLEKTQKMDVPYPTHNKGDLIPNFIDSIKNNSQPNVSYLDIFRVMEICISSWEAIEKGKTVKLSYLV